MNRAARSSQAHPWSRHDIETARTAQLAPILVQKGYATLKLPNGAVLLKNFRGLLIHGSRWSWNSEHLHGNPIDFFTTLEGKTFSQAMEILLACTDDPDDSCEDETQDDGSVF